MGTEDEGDSIYRVVNTRLLTYDLKVRVDIIHKTRAIQYREKRAINVIFANLLACLRKGQYLVYSRDTKHQSSEKKRINPRKIIKAIEFLSDEGYIVNVKGQGHINPEKRRISYIYPTEKFTDLFDVQMVAPMYEEIYNQTCPVVELRDEKKKPISFRSSKMTVDMENMIRKLNEINEKAEIRDGNGELLTNIYCRVFNENFEYGGRFYKADILRLKHKKNQERFSVTINGEAVTEVDFSNLHFRIAAAKEGIPDSDIPADVYTGILEDTDNYVDREIVKLAVNIMFNSYDDRDAIKAIQGEINKLPADEKLIYTLGLGKSVFSLVCDNYPDFVDLFCNGDSYGRRLQNDDSNLAADILSVFVEKEIPILPVHDSFVVAEKYEELLIQTMGDCFRARFGIDTMIPVTVSFKQDGAVYKNHILA